MLIRIVIIVFFISFFNNLISFSNELRTKNDISSSKITILEKYLSLKKLKINKDNSRDVNIWKKKIINYSKKHYSKETYFLDPKVIVLHYTAGNTFPWNLVKTSFFANEEPGLSSHYVVDEKNIWEILPTNIISRGAYGINHVAINIEMIAENENDLYKRKRTLDLTTKLVYCLMKTYSINENKVYSHSIVSKMNKNITPEVYDLIDNKPYGKIDPGKKNMDYIMKRLKKEKSN